MLEEIELFVAGAGPEIVAIDDKRFLGRFARLVDDGHAALLAERRIGQHQVVFAVLPGQCVFHQHWNFALQSGTAILAVSSFSDRLEACPTLPDAMQQEIHAAEPADAVDQLNAYKRAALQPPLLCEIERLMF